MRWNFQHIKRSPLRVQLIILVTIIIIISSGIFSFFNSRLQRELIVSEYEKSTQTILEAVRLGLEIGLQEENYESINTVLSWGMGNNTLSFIALTDDTESIIASYPQGFELSLEQIKSFPESISLSDSIYVVSGSWFSNLTGNGEIYLGFKTQYIRDIENKLWVNLGIIIVFVLIGSYVSSYFLALNIMKPLERLKEVTMGISDNMLDKRADEENGSQEIRVVAASFNTMIDKLLESQKQRIDQMREFNESLEERNARISEAYSKLEKQSEIIKEEKERSEQAFEDLKEAQTQLIQSEKMASLGQLVAGVAHEINTPAGAIHSAIKEIQKDYIVLLKQMFTILNALDESEQELYLAACQVVMTGNKRLSTSEQRSVAKDIRVILDQHTIPHSRFVSRLLAQVGFTDENSEQFIPLFQSDVSDTIVESLSQLGMSQIQVRDIQISIDRIIHLVKALKSYTHVDDETLSLTSLEEDLNNTLIILHNKIKRAITVEKDFDDLPQVRCYPDKLNQVWTNLIHNSIQAMRGDGKITLRLKKVDEEWLRVDVEDNGPGIPEEIQEKIFEPYFTTKSKGEGTGLGLSICRQIVDAHQGRIEIVSKPGKTIFSIYLPILGDFNIKGIS